MAIKKVHDIILEPSNKCKTHFFEIFIPWGGKKDWRTMVGQVAPYSGRVHCYAGPLSGAPEESKLVVAIEAVMQVHSPTLAPAARLQTEGHSEAVVLGR